MIQKYQNLVIETSIKLPLQTLDDPIPEVVVDILVLSSLRIELIQNLFYGLWRASIQQVLVLPQLPRELTEGIPHLALCEG